MLQLSRCRFSRCTEKAAVPKALVHYQHWVNLEPRSARAKKGMALSYLWVTWTSKSPRSHPQHLFISLCHHLPISMSVLGCLTVAPRRIPNVFKMEAGCVTRLPRSIRRIPRFLSIARSCWSCCCLPVRLVT